MKYNRILMSLTWDANRRRFFKGKPISKVMLFMATSYILQGTKKENLL